MGLVYRLIFGGIMILSHIPADAQDSSNYAAFSKFEKSKEKAVANLKNFTKPDTARVNALISVFTTATFLKERQEVTPFREEALALSRKLNYTNGLAQCYLSMANLYKSASDYTNALQYYDSVLYIAGDLRDKTMLSFKTWAYEQKGMIYYTRENYYMALDNFLEALKYAEYNNRNRNIHLHTFITEVYTDLNNLEKAAGHARMGIAMVESDSSAALHSNVYFSYIDVCFAKNDLEEAASYLDKIRPFVPHPVEVQMNFGYYRKKGKLHYIRQQYDSAFYFYQLAYKYSTMGGHKNSISAALRSLSGTALKLGHNEAAKDYAMQGLALAEEINTNSGKAEALANLSSYYHQKGENKKAYELLEQAVRLKDSLLSETNIRQINTLTAIYESDKQQKEITRLQNEREIQAAAVRQKSALNIVFIISILLLLILGYLGYMNFKKGQQIARQQQALQQQKIIDLEKDKQILSIDAMLKGQEEERSRIAKDLHDGLGGLLSGTKLSFVNIKENLALTPENAVQFDRSLSMLDNTIGDLRKVAQNLMPEALVKFGLHEAVRDFCDSIQASSGMKVSYQEPGEKRKLNSTAEVFAYRIIQELVNNAVKHAEANRVIVQLAMNRERVYITVEDDGKGFDKSNTARAKGAGMANIHYRVQYFNGTTDVVTSPGNGTSINIVLIA